MDPACGNEAQLSNEPRRIDVGHLINVRRAGINENPRGDGTTE